MLKQLFGLALLSTLAVGRLTWNDRQLNPGADQGSGNEWQYCEDKCNESCIGCQDHNVCKDDEKWCKDGPIKETPDGFKLHLCPVDEICVSKKCDCPITGNDGTQCGIVCACDCNDETEICCEQEDDENGCPVNPICQPRGVNMTNDICPGFCVEACAANQIACEQPLDPYNGCPHPDLCQDKDVSTDTGKFCDIQQCTLKCEVTHHLCEGEVKSDGCKAEEDICVEKQVTDLGMCPGVCPEECQDGWILCDGQVDYYGDVHKHCIGQSVCHVKAKDTNGVFCPDDSASHMCEKTCPEHQILCPPGEGQLGCREREECTDRTTDNEGDYCPDHSDCPTVCEKNEVNCPGGYDPVTTCKNPDLCIEEERDFNGDLCPVHCPETCTDDQVYCPGTRNPMTGCKSKDKCVNKETHKWGETPDAQCPGWCPVICMDDEVLCPSYTDPCNGCPTEEICRQAIKNKNGEFCPGKEFTIRHEGEDYRDNLKRRGGHLSASHNCPVYCKEWEGEIQCPVYEDVLGCKPEASCVKRQEKSNVNGTIEYCPATSVCPKQCPLGQKLCHYAENDEDGCHHEDVCVPIAKIGDTNDLCPMDWCPPLCSFSQTLTPGVPAPNGCPGQPVCV